MNLLGYIYIGTLIYMIIYCSKMKTLTLFSPLAYFVSFLFSDLFPLYLPQDKQIPQVMYFNTNVAMVINMCFLFGYRKLYKIKPVLHISNFEYEYYVSTWKKLICCFVALYILSGIITGTLQGFLSGANMEDMRRTSEVGIGFLRDIPLIGSMALILIILIYKGWDYKKYALTYCVLSGLTFMASTGGNRGVLLLWMSVFVTYMAFTYRGLKWYEYVLWTACINIGGAIMGAIRRGEYFLLYLSNMTVADIFCGYQNIVFNNSISLIYVAEHNGFFHGQEMLSNAAYFIPRFLWKDKPVSFGYTMKDLAGYKFDGGGIMPTGMEYSYVNWGDLWFIDYIIFLLILHIAYKKILISKSYLFQVLSILLVFNINYLAHVVKYVELLVLFYLFIHFVYSFKKQKILNEKNKNCLADRS